MLNFCERQYREYLLGNCTEAVKEIALVPLHGGRGDISAAPSTSTDTTATASTSSGTNIRHSPLNVNVGAHLTQQIYALTHPALSSAKTIGNCGSFALIFNNLVGPAMLGFPNLFQQVLLTYLRISINFQLISTKNN